MHQHYHLSEEHKHELLVRFTAGILVLVCLLCGLLLLWLTGWGEFPPRSWRDFAIQWMHGRVSLALFGYGIESIFPVLLVTFVVAVFPLAKRLFQQVVEQKQEPDMTGAKVPEQQTPLLLTPPVPSTTVPLSLSVASPERSPASNQRLLEQQQELEHRQNASGPISLLSSTGELVDAPLPSPEMPLVIYKPTNAEAEVSVFISLLGEMKVWLEMNGEQFYLPIKSHRRQELLTYIATHAPDYSKRVSSGRILTDVFEHISPRADVDNLRGLFQKHTQLLRKEVNEVVQKAGFPKIKLFQHEKVDNSSTKWWLSDECKVVDLSAITQLSEHIDAAKEQGPAGTQALKNACDRLITLYQSYQGDYLEKHLLHDEFGDCDWVRVPFTEYRDVYLQALWDSALAEHTTSMQQTLPERQRYSSAKRAASLYRTYALHAPRNRDFDLNARKSKRQSERALRGCLRMCRWLMDSQGADEAYSSYERLMADNFPEWKPSVNTVEILRTVRQLSGESMSLNGILEPPEE